MHGHRRQFSDLAVHDRLGVSRIVGLIVAVPPVTDHVDDHIALELLAIIECQSQNAHGGFGIVAVHMENRRLHHARDIGCIRRGTRIIRQRGETDLIVDHQMQRAAGRVAIELGKVQRLRDYALSGKSRIAVDQQRDYAELFFIAQALLFGAHHPFDHGIHRLQMAGIGGQRNHDFLARGSDERRWLPDDTSRLPNPASRRDRYCLQTPRISGRAVCR